MIIIKSNNNKSYRNAEEEATIPMNQGRLWGNGTQAESRWAESIPGEEESGRTGRCRQTNQRVWCTWAQVLAMTVLSSSKRQWSLSPDAATEIPVSFAQGLPKLPTSQRLICPLLWEGLGSSVATVAARWHHYNLSTLAGRLSNVWKSHTDPYMLPQG